MLMRCAGRRVFSVSFGSQSGALPAGVNRDPRVAKFMMCERYTCWTQPHSASSRRLGGGVLARPATAMAGLPLGRSVPAAAFVDGSGRRALRRCGPQALVDDDHFHAELPDAAQRLQRRAVVGDEHIHLAHLNDRRLRDVPDFARIERGDHP